MVSTPAEGSSSPLPPPWQAELAALPPNAALLIDTAPWIYQLEAREPWVQRFAPVFEAAAAGRIRLVLTTVTLAEVLTGPLQHGDPILTGRIAAALKEHDLRPLDAETAADAAALRVQYRLRLPDAIQLATALRAGCHALVTHDRDFARVLHLPIWR